MKIRTVTVFYGPGRLSAWPFTMVVPDYSGVDPDQVLGGLLAGPHPEDREAEPEPDSAQAVMREYVRQLAPLFHQMSTAQLTRIPLGTQWHDGCVEFLTTTGDVVVIPLSAVARILLGPIREAEPGPPPSAVAEYCPFRRPEGQPLAVGTRCEACGLRWDQHITLTGERPA